MPGSGKTTLARQLSPVLKLPLIDKDDILERLLDLKNAGDATWRRRLSRESDAILAAEGAASEGAILVSHWRLAGMPQDSGTPLDWLSDLSNHVVNVRCICSPELAAKRFFLRKRHPGHLDDDRSFEDVLAGIQAVARLGHLDIGPRIDADTSKDLQLDALVDEIRVTLDS